jgi:hypothetical protein
MGCCEHGVETLLSVKNGEFLEQISYWKLFKKA